MNGPTSEQSVVLDAPDRVRIVRAAPGCGKTWLVAEAIRRVLAIWKPPGGIAALSFTNIGGNEIRRAVGHDLPHPHFVGTLDSFVYRYIVRQFAHVLNPRFRRLVLVPPEALDDIKFTDQCVIKLPELTQPRTSLFDLTFVGGVGTGARLAIKIYGKAQLLSTEGSKQAIAAKHRLWSNQAWASYSDITYIAAAVLRDATHGQRLRELITARFPFIIVDELQDTGWYLSEVVRDLLGIDASRGLLVGDPDQAIYEFNGARPELFDEFKKITGSREFAVRKSLRCPEAVVGVANHLLSGTAQVVARDGDPGTAIMVVTDKAAPFLNKVREILGEMGGIEIHNIVTRANAGIDELEGGKVADTPKFSSRPLSLVHLAGRHIAGGASRKAMEAAKCAILYVLTDLTAPSTEMLQKLGVEELPLRVAAARMIHASRALDDKETSHAWGERVKKTLLAAITMSGWTREDQKPCGIKSCSKELTAPIAPTFRRSRENSTHAAKVAVRTVHGVKGETHDTTFVFAPKGKSCISDDWWTTEPNKKEERRIAFVAVTRSRQNLVLCVSTTTAKNLQTNQPDFFNAFAQTTEADYLAALEAKLTAKKAAG